MKKERHCPKCKKYKNLKSFGLDSRAKDKLKCWCLSCEALQKKAIPTFISNLYGAQKYSSKVRGYESPSYSKEWFSNWLLNETKFYSLYNNWEKSGYLKDLTPSVDRLKDSIGYTKSNIQLVTWKENNSKSHEKQKKKINQYSKDGIFIASYNSLAEASQATGAKRNCISSAASGRYKTSGGFIWKIQK